MKAGPLLVRFVKGFAMFWWDFLVGDTPELFVAAISIIGVVALLSEAGHFNGAAIVTLPLLAVVALGVSIKRAQRAARRK
ncbi:MAG: hypothetical protein HKL86_04920 [Acidimicrobiaceae bacterium]|nr:hypothetical protein [Acidimicrobiaceae bacterium]